MTWTRPVTVSLLLSVVLLAALPTLAAEGPAKTPKDRVAAIYFHRTQRCPTCKRISAYAEEAVKAGFARQMKKKQVSFHLIDYQDRKNQKYTKSYRISGPTLVLAKVENGKVTTWKPMPKVWSLVGKKKDFLEYVRDGVRSYLEKR